MVTFSADPIVAEQQMHAVIFYLAAFGYIDGQFDGSERQFVRDHIGKLVQSRAEQSLGAEIVHHRDTVARWTGHFHEVLDETDQQIRDWFTESVGEGETTQQFVVAKLKLRCFELFRKFDEQARGALLSTVDELMKADGVVHPNEAAFRNELAALLSAPVELDEAELETVEEGAVVVAEATRLEPKQPDHPFFRGFELDYARDRATFAKQAEIDMSTMGRFLAKLDEQRTAGRGRLDSAADFTAFAGAQPFLDGHVYVHPPRADREYELLVVGDLHGCYSCLKAALLQADFFTKVQAHHDDPERAPYMGLVLLGDYIDRGRYSYSGILRTAMQLFLAAPEHVFVLRGNHEYYVEINGKVLAPVRPCEAMDSIKDVASNDLFAAYMRLFEQLPNMLVFDRTIFVHAGIPRDDTQALKWTGLASLNDPEIRFQMLWSDPSEADVVPRELQAQNARFPFGRRQFKSFMQRIGCKTLVRGHERVVEGFKTVYDDADARLLTLFSAGGATNDDLPASSNYRQVTPMALTLKHKAGVAELTPFPIEYERFNDPKYNAFFRSKLGG